MVRTSPRASFLSLCVLLLSLAPQLGATDLPENFSESVVVSGLRDPTFMAFAPDGRIFVSEQGGTLRVVKDGKLLETPFLTLPVGGIGENGLLGIAFDPNFESNRHLYVFYTTELIEGVDVYNRVSRFTASGDVVQPGSEQVLLEIGPLTALQHNSGAMRFGPDGKLYIGTGDNHWGARSQLLTDLRGKILRINPDGSIPEDNPFYDEAEGVYRSIWAMGLRNPFSWAIDPETNRMFTNDVGDALWEEINELEEGGNYGWPLHEGPGGEPDYIDPLFSFGHGTGENVGCSIVGAAFYQPSAHIDGGAQHPAHHVGDGEPFPEQYHGRYFFADYCNYWIRSMDPNDYSVDTFALDALAPVGLEVGPDGALYYLSRGLIYSGGDPVGAIYKIAYGGDQLPKVTAHPETQVVTVGSPATFSVQGTGGQPLYYQWLRNGQVIPGANDSTYTLPYPTRLHNGQRYRCIVTNSHGYETSEYAFLWVTPRTPPSPIIVWPSDTKTYYAGEEQPYLGYATDEVDGVLPPVAYSWRIDFHHDTHFHPFLPQTTGSNFGSVLLPNLGETSTNVWYRFHLTVTNSAGLKTSIYKDIHPDISTISLETSPPGLQLTMDSVPITAPYSEPSVVGMIRNLGAPTTQTLNGVTYRFVSWSNGGNQFQNTVTPPTDTTFTATYEVAPVE